MKIVVKDLENLNNALKEKTNQYKDNITDYYRHIEQVRYDWYDDNSERFYQDVPSDRNNDFKIIDEMNKISKVYDYLIDNYKSIGKTIYFNPSKKDDILSLLDEMIETVNKIISNYNNIGISNYSERGRLYNQQNSFINIREKIKYLKRELKRDMKKINEIETNSKTKFKNIQINKVNNKDIKPYMKGWDQL